MKKYIIILFIFLFYAGTAEARLIFNGVSFNGIRIGGRTALPLGDSITNGYSGGIDATGYRGYLWNLLAAAGNVTYATVGSQASSGGGVATYKKHAGVNGETTAQIKARTAAELAYLPSSSWYYSKNNIVLLHAGTNDMSTGMTGTITGTTTGTTVDGVNTLFGTEVVVGDKIGKTAKGFRRVEEIYSPTQLRVESAFDAAIDNLGFGKLNTSFSSSVQNVVDTIALVKAYDSNIAVYVAKIIPILESNANVAVTTYNSELESAINAAIVANNYSEVYIIDMHTPFNDVANCPILSDCFSYNIDTGRQDRLHPSDTGYEVMADTWAAAILANEN